MKPKSYLGAIALLVLIFSACKKDTSGIKDTAGSPSDNPTIAYIKSLGFQSSEIKDLGNDYAVDGDILFSKKATYPAASSGGSKLQTNQYGTSNYIGYNTSIVVAIDPSMSSYTSEITAAMAVWSNVTNCKLSLTLYNGTTPANITIIEDSGLGAGICGAANFPINGAPGAQVRINLSQMGYFSSFSQMESLLIHELGHTIGFRHTNWQTQGEPRNAVDPATNARANAVHILGTPTGGDASSIMNGGTCGNTSVTLSSADIVAVQFLYPLNPPVAGTVPVFRYFNTGGDHFYTTDYSELGDGNNYGYIFEGVGFFAYNTAVTGSVPIYRFYSISSGDHYYTQVYGAIGGYNYEGPKFYAMPNQVAGSVPILGYFNGVYHFYTKNSVEATTANYYFELNAFYAY